MRRADFDLHWFAALREQRGVRLGAPIEHSAVTGSTNDDALRAARQGAPHGAVFVADHQTGGRGRRGRHWHAEPGESLLFSVVLRLSIAMDALPALSLASGLAARRVLGARLAEQASGKLVRLKWPNDVWIGEQKVAGVLAETQLQGSVLTAAVVGIGVNVASSSFPGDLAESATSLLLHGAECRREELLVDLLARLDEVLSDFERTGVGGLATELARYDALQGRRLAIEGLHGTARGIDSRGRLLLCADDGSMHTITSGTVELER